MYSDLPNKQDLIFEMENRMAEQQAQQKAQEAAKDAVSKILGGSANSAQGEAADSLSQQQKTTEAVKGVLNLFKKKN